MIEVKHFNVPSKPRSKYQQQGTTTIINNTTTSSGGSVSLPFEYDENGIYFETQSLTTDKIEKYDTLANYITTETEDDWQYYSLNGDSIVDGMLGVADSSLFVGTVFMNDFYAFSPSYISELTTDKITADESITTKTLISNGDANVKGSLFCGPVYLSNNNLLNCRNFDHMAINYSAGQSVYTKIYDGLANCIASFGNQGSNITGGLYVDNLTVSGTLQATLYEAKKVRATNGDLLVTDSGTIEKVIKVLDPLVTITLTEPAGFEVGDIVAIQQLNGLDVLRQDYTVTASDGLNLGIKHNDSYMSFTPKAGDTVVRVSGNLIKLSADEQVIDLKTGDDINTRIGKLEGLNELEGYGLYSDNAYITGDIHARNLTLDNKLTSAEIETDELVVKYLQTKSEGTRIEAFDHQLLMVDGEGNQKLIVSGESYNTMTQLLDSDGTKLHKVTAGSISVSNTYGGSITGTKTSTICSSINIPDGTYAVNVPSVTISGNLKLTRDDLLDSSSNYGRVVMRVVLSNGTERSVIANRIVTASGHTTKTLSLTSSAEKIAVKAGTYTLFIELEYDITANGFGSASITSSTSDNLEVVELSNQTKIYANGLAYKASSEKYFAVLDADGLPVFLVRAGNYILRISESGIQASSDKGATWRSL